ncbi:MAG TPA: SDR family NAD(P)-dependent oxidoreductase, partial [Thermoanaerobaculia bacterium]|nr:SDR family NAD(P)-dependent oxidoreductase [Thermoanaerobaculia bacterium]
LDGILHSAGMIADRFILNKTAAELTAVLTPKVSGTVHLDLASRDVELDFFVLFSSIAGAMGNPGQADYAMANGFMDQFAAYRNAEVAAGRRHGRTRSINWPLWQSGGMKLDRAAEELMRQTTGMHGMQTAIGMEAFHRCLALSCDQMLVVEGDLARIRRVWLAEPEVPAAQAKPSTAGELAGESFAERTQDYLRREFSELLKLPFHKIDPQAPLEKYGIDSILAMRLTNQLEKTFGSLSKTLFFEYQTIAALAGYLMKAHAAVLREKFGLLQQEPAERAQRTAVEPRKPVSARRSRSRFGGSRAQVRSDIAIVGVAGRYPQAGNLLEFWRNLKEGRDCITEIPPERWDHRLYFDPDPNKAGRSYSKWGGFIADVDKFDPLFFNISPKEAEVIDPQERLFLETAWETIEDAGHTRESIAGRRVGVYVGVMWSQYELFGAESVARGNPTLGGSSHASIANRVSYFFDLHGPSIALDTMCSSSLTAIHLACEELRRGEIEAAIAGGVNISIHPYKYLSLSHGRFAATDGRCRSFGAGGDGYVPGEGVGAVLLKPLEHALRDGDQIYAVIKSSTVNHGGKTNGYTVPNPNAQGDLIREALRKAGIDPKTLSYIETHGTGTSLGDPIEITGLLRAFDGAAGEKQFCPIGSVKSNIGHLESAAGIAALTKVLLQIRHKQLVPSLHAEPLNPNIDFENSPFYVQTELSEWKRPDSHPRRVGISSFGAGGANAHLILEEYTDGRESEQPHAAQREVFLLSAKTPDALRRYAERVVRFLEEAPDVSLPGMAYTSQIGRSAMDARLAVLTSSVEELKTKLSDWLARFDPGDAAAGRGIADPDGVFYGSIKDAPYTVSFLTHGAAGRAFLGALLADRDLEKIAGLWVLGADVQWSLLHPEGSRAKVSLPTYPFARERYWVSVDTPSLRVVQERAPELRKVIAPAPVEEPRRTYYVPQWTARALGARDEKSGGPVLVLDPAGGLFEALKKQAGSDSAASMILVKPDLEFQEIGPNEYSLDIRSDEDLQRLVDRLRERALIPAAIVHRAGTCSLENRHEVERELHNGFHALLALCRALMRETHAAPLRVLSVVSNESAAAAPLAAAVDGFFRTLTLEDPKFATKSLDLESADDTFAEQAAIVWNELLEKEWTRPEIRYRRSLAGEAREMTRSVRTLVPMAAPDRRSPLPLKQNGVYLITGGMGGLGLIFAEYLAKKVQARLVLVGRSTPGEGQLERIERLRSLGAEVLALQGDVSVQEDAERIVREARAQFHALDGVLHSAGVNRDAFILRKTRQEIDAVLAPKVHGTIALDLATAGENLDFFVLFSSIAGVMGNAGQSDYAFGNRFQDAFAERRESLRKEQKRNGRTISINWPLWEEGGMGIAPDKVVLLEKQTGMIPLPSQEGIQYWEDLLRSDATQCVALYGIASRIASVIGGQPVRAERGKAARAESADPAALSAKTEAYLKALVGEEIKLAPERIGSAERLESFGIDSVMINKINAQLERDLGALPKTLLYEHETIRELAAYLVREAREALITRLGIDDVPEEPAAAAGQPVEEETVRYEVVSVREREEMDAVAIIGVHGSYPHSEDLNRY